MWSKTIIFSVLLCSVLGLELEVVNQWNFLDFEFPYDPQLINSFRPENTVFTGLEVTEDRVFLATPRLYSGVVSTLSFYPRHVPLGSSPRLQAYPSWDAHTAVNGDTKNCTGLISVYRIRRDSCNRLWVLDSGVMTSLEDFRPTCPPKLMIFDLKTDQIVRVVTFPRQVLRPSSLLTNLIIDESVQGVCDSAFVYMSDTAAPALVVYNAAQDSAWRVMHPAMFPDPDFGEYTIAEERFTLMDGIVGLAHSPKLGILYFQPLATDRLFSIPTSALTKGPLAQGEDLPITLVGKKSSQGLGLALNTRDETLYFSPVRETSVATWNPVTSQQKLIAYDTQSLQFPAEIRYSEQENCIWLLSTRFQKFFRKTVNANEVNLRVIRINLSPPLNPGLTNNIFF